MKRVLFFYILILANQYCRADYFPFVEEGKSWNFLHMYRLLSTQENALDTITCELRGDTIINDVAYKKYYVNGLYTGAFRESGEKVFFLKWEDESLCYDFNLKKDDVFSSVYTNCRVVQEDYIESCGMKLRCLGICNEDDPTSDMNYWVEGIGSLGCLPEYSIYANLDGGATFIMLSCRIGEQYLYRNTDVKVESPLQTSPRGGNDALYDLQGRRLSGDGLPKGIYIHGGKKRIIR